MSDLSSSEIVSILKKYQANKYVHPLTCGQNSRHELLEPYEDNGKVYLRCPECDYIQEVSNWLSESIIELADYEYPWSDSMKDLMK